MNFGKKSNPLQWEKVLKVLVTGKSVNREILETIPEMKNIPLYRLSYYIYQIKLAGGIVKVTKNGRVVDKYQLANVDVMAKYLSDREVIFSKNTDPNKVNKLSDVSSTVITDTSVDKYEVEGNV